MSKCTEKGLESNRHIDNSYFRGGDCVGVKESQGGI